MVGDDGGSCSNGTGKQGIGGDVALCQIFGESMLDGISYCLDTRRADFVCVH